MKITIARRCTCCYAPPIEIEIPDDTPERERLRVAVLAAAQLGLDLRGANLTDADLTDADLTDAERDVRLILFEHAAEVPGLLAALRVGKVDGSTYSGPCACLVGTIANVRGCDVSELERDSNRPAERLFLAIREGDTPETNPIAKIVEGWIVDWQARYGERASASPPAGQEDR